MTTARDRKKPYSRKTHSNQTPARMSIKALLKTWPGTISASHHVIVSFDKVREANGWLSNMSPHELRVPRGPSGDLYHRAEHYFQCERFADPAIRKEIMSEKSPMSCKMKAKKHKEHMVIVPHSAADLGLMRRTLRHKIDNHPNLLKDLFALPKNCVIIENATKRQGPSARFWGMRYNEVTNQWVGDNWLGRLWMELREEATRRHGARTLVRPAPPSGH